jgi:hypothetical protein
MNDWTSLFRSLTADTLDTVDTLKSVNSVQSVNVSKGEEEAPISPLVASLAALERRPPDHIEAADWQRAVEDGYRFLIQWGKRATALGWVDPDVFRLPPVPPNPHPSWRRLARVDQLGLVWLTQGRPVTSITAESATIATPRGGSVAFYRPNQPASRLLTDNNVDNVDNVDNERPTTTPEPRCPAKTSHTEGAFSPAADIAVPR